MRVAQHKTLKNFSKKQQKTRKTRKIQPSRSGKGSGKKISGRFSPATTRSYSSDPARWPGIMVIQSGAWANTRSDAATMVKWIGNVMRLRLTCEMTHVQNVMTSVPGSSGAWKEMVPPRMAGGCGMRIDVSAGGMRAPPERRNPKKTFSGPRNAVVERTNSMVA